MRFRVSARRLVGFDDRNDGCARPSANFEFAYSSADTRRAAFNREPLQHEVSQNYLCHRQTSRHVRQSADNTGDLPGLTVRKPQDRCRAIHVSACEMVELARAIVVNDDDQTIAGQRLNLKLAPDAGKKHFADSGHDDSCLPFINENPGTGSRVISLSKPGGNTYSAAARVRRAAL